MNGEIPHVHAEAERYSVESADLDLSTRHFFQLGDHTPPNHGLERVCGRVPDQADHKKQAGQKRQYQVFPESPTTRLVWAIVHRGLAPAEGMGTCWFWIRPSARRFRSHVESRSLIFCCVSSSLIFGATSERASSLAPDLRSWGI